MTGALAATFTGALGGFTLDAAFEVPLNGVTALFGPSGSGKTSVLRCVAGLTRVPGRLEVDGEAWQDDARSVFRPPHRRPIGYVFQEASLFAHLSVRDNLLYGRRRARREGGPETAEVVAVLGLERLLHRNPDRLSGGERQRVALGRALLARPRLLLMDEPLSALDRGARDEILPYLEALRDGFGLPILYVSHDFSEVARLADRMVLLSVGQVLATGPVESLLERLDLGRATGRFEAGALLSATVIGHDRSLCLTRLTVSGQSLEIPLTTAPEGATVRLRVRARDVALATRAPTGLSIRNVLQGTIAEVVEEPETAYAETLIDLGDARLRARVTRASLADLKLRVGSPVHALIKSIALDGGRRTGPPTPGTRPD